MLNGPLSRAATATAGVSVDVSLSIWHGLTPALLLSVLTLAARRNRVCDARRPSGRAPGNRATGTEDLYDGVLSVLNTVSRVIGPALHSASLRTYIMVIVATWS